MDRFLQRTRFTFFWPLITATALCLPGLFIFLISVGHSPMVFNDWDEPLYLLILEKVGNYSFEALSSRFPSTPIDFTYLPRFYSHSLVDFIIGNIGSILALPGPLLLLGLDWLCILFSFLAFCNLFAKFVKEPLFPECAAATALLFPYLFGAGVEALHLHYLSINQEPTLNSFPSIPSMRGIYTQISIPIFIFNLNFLVDELFNSSEERYFRKSFLKGCLGGILIYIYSFSWIALCCLAPVLVVAASFKQPENRKKLGYQLTFYLLGVFIISFPGLVLSAGMRDAIGMHKGVGSPFSIWMPLDYIGCLGVLYLLLRKVKFSGHGLWSTAFVSCIIAEICLRNLEFLTQQIWTSYHFSLFFLRPIMTGLIFIPFRIWLEKFTPMSSNLNMLIVFILVAVGALAAGSFINYRNMSGEQSIISYLSEFENGNSSRLGIPMISTEDADLPDVDLLPFWTAALTKKDVFFSEALFQQNFGIPKYGFPLLRTSLITGGLPKAFCQRMQSTVIADIPYTLNRWAVIDFQNQCRELPKQLDVLCHVSDWSTWLPTHIIVNESYYQKGLHYRHESRAINRFKTNPEQILLSVSPNEERNHICKASLASALVVPD